MAHHPLPGVANHTSTRAGAIINAAVAHAGFCVPGDKYFEKDNVY